MTSQWAAHPNSLKEARDVGTKKPEHFSIFQFSFLFFFTLLKLSKMKIFALSAIVATVLATVSEAAVSR